MAEETEGLDPFGFAGAGLTAPMGMDEQIAYAIWGAVATSTRAFGNCEIKIDSNIQRVFVKVTLKRWATYKKLERFHRVWLDNAEKKALKMMPQSWRLLVHYDRQTQPNGATGSDSK